jgi:post-segregation antitoxin (ccd killing protein)
MGKKVRTTLYLDSVVLKEAQEMGLNVSKTCENALKIAIYRLRTIYAQDNSKNPILKSANNQVEPRAGFEPATAALPRRCPTRLGHRG